METSHPENIMSLGSAGREYTTRAVLPNDFRDAVDFAPESRPHACRLHSAFPLPPESKTTGWSDCSVVFRTIRLAPQCRQADVTADPSCQMPPIE